MSRVLIVGPQTFAGGVTPPDRPGRSSRAAKSTAGAGGDDRPPVCPVCQQRLVILATHPGRAADGRPIRRQLWGCPRGHATTYRVDGTFGPFDLLDDLSAE